MSQSNSNEFFKLYYVCEMSKMIGEEKYY